MSRPEDAIPTVAEHLAELLADVPPLTAEGERVTGLLRPAAEPAPEQTRRAS